MVSNRLIVVNATCYPELDRFSDEVVERLAMGAVFVFQSAASFVKSLVGCPSVAPVGLNGRLHAGPGLIVVGSYAEQTTRQLHALLASPGLEAIPVDVDRVLRDEDSLFALMIRKLRRTLDAGITPVVFTSRALKRFSPCGGSAGRRATDFLVRFAPVAASTGRPSFLIAKGGITAHDVLMHGLKITSARVWGQAAPGIPVLRMPPGHRWAGMPDVIFPGNVGSEGALRQIYRRFSGNIGERPAGAEQ